MYTTLLGCKTASCCGRKALQRSNKEQRILYNHVLHIACMKLKESQFKHTPTQANRQHTTVFCNWKPLERLVVLHMTSKHTQALPTKTKPKAIVRGRRPKERALAPEPVETFFPKKSRTKEDLAREEPPNIDLRGKLTIKDAPRPKEPNI